jgi:hypothetical protein
MSYGDVRCIGNATWIAPPADQFDTTHDCTLFGQFLSLIIRYNAKFASSDLLDHFDRLATEDKELCRVPITATENYIVDALPLEFRPSSCELIAWYYGNGSFCARALYKPTADNTNIWDPYVQKLVYEPRRICNQELRSALGLSGNPDVAGVGVCTNEQKSICLHVADIARSCFRTALKSS